MAGCITTANKLKIIYSNVRPGTLAKRYGVNVGTIIRLQMSRYES